MVLLGRGGQGPREGGVGLWWTCPAHYTVSGPGAHGTQSGWEMGNRPRDSGPVPRATQESRVRTGRGGDTAAPRPPDPGFLGEESGFCLPPPLAKQLGHRTPPSPSLPLPGGVGWASNLGLNPESPISPGKVAQHTSPSWTWRVGCA